MGIWQTIHKNERHKKRKLYLFYVLPSIIRHYDTIRIEKQTASATHDCGAFSNVSLEKKRRTRVCSRLAYSSVYGYVWQLNTCTYIIRTFNPKTKQKKREKEAKFSTEAKIKCKNINIWAFLEMSRDVIFHFRAAHCCWCGFTSIRFSFRHSMNGKANDHIPHAGWNSICAQCSIRQRIVYFRSVRVSVIAWTKHGIWSILCCTYFSSFCTVIIIDVTKRGIL